MAVGTFATIHLCALSDPIETLTGHLEHLAHTKSLAPTRRVNMAFSDPRDPEILDAAMIQSPRRGFGVSQLAMNLYLLWLKRIVGFDNSRPPTEDVADVTNHEFFRCRSIAFSE